MSANAATPNSGSFGVTDATIQLGRNTNRAIELYRLAEADFDLLETAWEDEAIITTDCDVSGTGCE